MNHTPERSTKFSFDEKLELSAPTTSYEILPPDEERLPWQVVATGFSLCLPTETKTEGLSDPVDMLVFFPNEYFAQVPESNGDRLRIAENLYKLIVITEDGVPIGCRFDLSVLKILFGDPEQLARLIANQVDLDISDENVFSRRSGELSLLLNANPDGEHMQVLAEIAQLVSFYDHSNLRKLVEVIYVEKKASWDALDTVLSLKPDPSATCDKAIEIINRRKTENLVTSNVESEKKYTTDLFIEKSVKHIHDAVTYRIRGVDYSPEITKALRLVKNNIGAKKYNLSEKHKRHVEEYKSLHSAKIHSSQEAMMIAQNKSDTDFFQKMLRLSRQEYAVNHNDLAIANVYTQVLSVIHQGNFLHEMVEGLRTQVVGLVNQPLEDLSHEQIALILSMQMELLTRPEPNFSSLDQQTMLLGQRLNEVGLFYINRPTGVGHDKNVLHGVLSLNSNGVAYDLCGVCTPVQALQFQSLVTAPLAPPPMVSGIGASFSTPFSPDLMSYLPSFISEGGGLFSQAFAFGEVGSEKPSLTKQQAIGSNTNPSEFKKRPPQSKTFVKRIDSLQSSTSLLAQPELKKSSKKRIAIPKKAKHKSHKTKKEMPSVVKTTPKLIEVGVRVEPKFIKKKAVVLPAKSIKKKELIKAPLILVKAPVKVRPSKLPLPILRLSPESPKVVSKKTPVGLSKRKPIGSVKKVVDVLPRTPISRKKISLVPTSSTFSRHLEKALISNINRQEFVKTENAKRVEVVVDNKTKRVGAETKIRKVEVNAKPKATTTESITKTAELVKIEQHAAASVVAVEKKQEITQVETEVPASVLSLMIGALMRPILKDSFPTEELEAIKSSAIEKRQQPELIQGRHRGLVKKKAQVVQPAMKARSISTNAMVDVADSFNTAREVRMWAQEALAYPKLIERYYSIAA